MKAINIQLLLTGDELMSGDIVDSNSAKIGEYLKSIGLTLSKKTTIADDINMLVNEIEHISQQADILIINGGLGPTVDDLTSEALAKVTKTKLSQHPLALAHLKEWCNAKGITLNTPNLKQALLPNNCKIIKNKTGSAVGIHLIHNDCNIFCTPGVPSELFLMFSDEIIPAIQDLYPKSSHTDVTRLHIYGPGESTLQHRLSTLIPNWSEYIELGFRADFPLLELKLTSHRQQDLALKEEYLHKIESYLGDHVLERITQNTKSLAEHLLLLLQNKSLKITTAESCTGGLIASRITAIPGSSQNFEAGFITYSNNMKNKMLSVDTTIIDQFGAVSEETAIAMASGALEKSGADLVIAVTGIAGPTGGSKEKPVGTVWISWGSKEKLITQNFLIKGNRLYFQEVVCARSLDLMRRLVINSKSQPHYIENMK